MKKLSPYFYYLLGAILISLLFFISFRIYSEWRGRYFFGEVVSVKNNQIIISDKAVGTRIVEIDSDTIFRKGRYIENLPPLTGDHIMVVGKIKDDGHIKSEIIRVFDKGKRN